MIYSINVKKREAGKADENRIQGLIPGTLYGPERESISVSVPYLEFEKLYKEAGESNLVDLLIEGEKEPVKIIVQDIQYNPVKGNIIHIDFKQIKMGEKMHATISIKFIGEAPAVKLLGGTLVKGPETVNIECLPKDLVSHIDVDLSKLTTFENVVHIGDLDIPAGIEVLDRPDTLLVKVAAPLTEDQLKAMEEADTQSVTDIEVEGEKKEGEEGEEVAKDGDKKEEDKKPEEKK